MSTQIPFAKMVGTGNDFLVVDAVVHRRLRRLSRQWSAISRALCDRHNGVGADGLLVLEPSSRATVRMRIFNPDGTEAEMCGNGARCVARYLKSRGRRNVERGTDVTIETKASILSAGVSGDRVAMRMTDPMRLQLDQSLTVGDQRLRYGFVDTGVPHVVVPVNRLEQVAVEPLGRAVRHHRRFSPRGTNVDFVQPDGRRAQRLRVRTYERGVEEETLACGTGVAAAAVIYALNNGVRGQGAGKRQQYHIDVQTRSGDVLRVSFAVTAGGAAPRITDLVLDGQARRVFDATIEWPMRRSG